MEALVPEESSSSPTTATTATLLLPLLPEGVFVEILTNFDVYALIEMKLICRNWKRICTNVIDMKCRGRSFTSSSSSSSIQPTGNSDGPKLFESNQELKDAVRKYCGYIPNPLPHNNDEFYLEVIRNPLSTKITRRQDHEEIAQIYGYPIGKWNVSQLTNFAGIFEDIMTFNEPINTWNICNATKMDGIFYNAKLFNQELCNWDTSNIKSMTCMFERATNFNQNLSMWNISNVITLDHMFANATHFNSPGLNSWNTSNVTNMILMFFEALSFNQDLSNWDTSNVTSMECMFFGAISFNYDILSHWDMSNVRGLEDSEMFTGATAYNETFHNNNNNNNGDEEGEGEEAGTTNRRRRIDRMNYRNV